MKAQYPNRTALTYAAWCAAALMLTACGGGGGHGSSSDPDPLSGTHLTLEATPANAEADLEELNIVSFTPANGKADVEIDAVFEAAFSETVTETSLNQYSFYLTGPEGVVPGDIALSADGLSARFTPEQALNHDSTYTATLTTAIENSTAPTRTLVREYSADFHTQDVWTKMLGTENQDLGMDIAHDHEGNLYILGLTRGSIDEQTLPGVLDSFITKFDSEGNKVWTRQWGTSDAGITFASAIAIDNTNHIYVTGGTAGAFPGQINQGSSDYFVSKLDSEGNILWSKQYGSAEGDYANGITLDGEGNIYLIGETSGTLDSQTNAGFVDIFISKLDTHGALQWTKQWGTNGYDYGRSIALNASGTHLYATGATPGDLDGNGEQENNGEVDIYILQITVSGVEGWIRQWGSREYDESNHITLDIDDNIYITGTTHGELDGHPSAGHSDNFLAKFNPHGEKLWMQQWGSASWDNGIGITTHKETGELYVASVTINGPTDADISLNKFDDNGFLQWIQETKMNGMGSTTGISIDNNHIYMTGFTQTDVDGHLNQGEQDVYVFKYNSKGYKK